MSRKPDDLDLQVIHQLANSHQDVQDLIDAKNKELKNLDKAHSINYKKLDPAPKPKGDIRFSKSHSKETNSREGLDLAKEDTENHFNKSIKQKMTEASLENDLHKDHQHQIQNMPDKDLSILSEKGVDAYRQHEKEQARDKEVLDLTMDDEKSKEIFGDPEIGQEINSNAEKEIIHDKVVEEDLKMDSTETEKVFDHQQGLSDFKDNSKDMDVGKQPSPSDDFE